jgi:hypothetical protein
LDTSEEESLAFVRTALNSVWTLEVMLLLRRQRSRAWSIDDLVRELRSSRFAIDAAVAALQKTGLVSRSSDGLCQFWPTSPELEQAAAGVERLYAAKPMAVVRAIAEANEEKLRLFARAFRLKE